MKLIYFDLDWEFYLEYILAKYLSAQYMLGTVVLNTMDIKINFIQSQPHDSTSSLRK